MERESPFVDSAPPDRYCDLVMKGGITSGIVYPLAILELARSYRFKKIGGTSVGAVAAVVTAAAEYRRRNGSSAGFESLRKLPEELASRVDGHSRLLSLFRPQPSTRRLFEVLLWTLNRTSTGRRWLTGLSGLVRAYAVFALAGALIGALLARFAAPLDLWAAPAYLVLMLVGGIVAMSVRVYLDVIRGLVPNGFGLCKCGPGADGAAPALVPWLHELVQRTAGLPDNCPLTFSDLWCAGLAECPDEAPPGSIGPQPDKAIELKVFTTNVTHGRPYLMPFEDDSSRLFFDPKDLESYFPPAILAYMKEHSKPYSPASDADPAAAPEWRELRELPRGELPVVVAVRLSLSFPLLISAVPLWAIDYEEKRGERRLRQCWFSDGGICANFPIHLFDSFVPRRPTFGITLSKRNQYRPDVTTWLPRYHEQGRGDLWNRFYEKPDAISRFGGFLKALVAAAQNWNDSASTRMPGVRDRIVHVRLLAEQGGLNLDMPEPLIHTLAAYGRRAGGRLRRKFLPPCGTAGVAQGWSEHRWVRFNVLLVGLRERMQGLAEAADEAAHSLPLTEQIRAAETRPPLAGRGETALSPGQAEALEGLLDALQRLEAEFAEFGVAQPYIPVPKPSLRVRPPL